MTINRRNVLVGIALVAVVSGLALGSGAFTQVEATRNVNLQVSDDSGALLTLDALDNSEIVREDGSGNNGAAQVQISNQTLNDDATIKVEEGLTVTNNGGQSVGFYVDDATTGVGSSSALDFVVNQTNPGAPSGSAGSSVVGSSVTLAPGDSVNLDVVIDTANGDVSTVGDVTFVADVDQA